jgi:ATP-binding cassette subfamily B protein
VSQAFRVCLELLALSWRTSRAKLLLAGVLMLAQAAAMPLAALALGVLTDAALAHDTGRAEAAALVVTAFVIGALTAGHFAHIAYFELGELNFLRMDRQLLDLTGGSPGLEQHERPEYADKVQVLTGELNRVSWVGMQAVLSGISLAVGIALTSVLLAMLNPWLLLLPLAAAPPILLGRKAEALSADARDAAAGPTRLALHLCGLATSAAAAKELRVFRMQREVRARTDRAWGEATATIWRGELRATGYRVAGQLVFATAYVVATLLVVHDAVAGHRSAGDVVLAIALAAQVNVQVTAAVTLLQELQRLARTLENLRWLRELTARQAPPPPDRQLPERIRDGIRLRGVSFRYPDTDRPVLDGVDLTLPAGSTVALVGDNGAGKTTLVKLLCRFYQQTGGEIELDGVDLRRFPLEQWRGRIAAGFQDFVRFELAAQQTVGVGDLPRVDSGEAVLAALERARAADVVDRLEQGLGTQLGTSYAAGAELSGGQWQKLALGRAMMRESPLLVVLDEPTSALDAQAEHQLFERYADHAARLGAATGAITLLVSHRFSTVRMADLILVVDGGRIAEAGSHAELMAAGGLYAGLYALQASQYR